MLDSVFLFDTPSSPIFGGSPHFGTLFRDNGSINAECRGQEFEYGKEGDSSDASYETGYSEKDVQGLKAFSVKIE